MGKFRDIASIVVICLLAVVLLASSAQAKPASVLLQEGLYAEEIEGDLDAAIKIYEQLAADKSAGARYAAQAMYRLGLCYQKKQDYQNAKATFEKLIARFPKEKSIIEKVQPLLDAMSAQDPAALMPAETLVYLEIGSPGKQIETILNMLKGTPFENPLAVISAAGGPSPKDMMAALLNPSMITEFKKIRGVALGFQAIHSDNPPLVAVIYPGESDALRGIIIAGLGMMFQAGEPIAGMQTLRMADIGGAAYDDNVIIVASPIDRLTWCVKQYKGITNEPTLASQNKAFQKLSRRQREQNAYTIWADVDRIFPMLKEEMPDEQRRLIESIGDIGNVDEFTACLSLEKDGIAVETNIGFKDGHNCLAYNLIRTPNISKAGFEAVPPQAVGLVSFALSESEGGGVAGARKALKKLTGLDIGRELFANIEQVTLFALPPTATSNKHLLAKNISPVVPCLGLAVTSHNSKRTHQLFTQLLTIANLAMNLSMGEESGQPTIPTPGKYRIGTFDDKPAYCYMGQAGKSTILSLTPEVLQTSLSSVKSGKSALSTGPLHEIINQLSPETSKLVAVNAGGAIKLVDAHICKSLDVLPDPNRNSLSQLFKQLAQACDKTYVQVRTDEQPNNFGLNVNISGLPEFGQIFPLLAQIPGAMENPMLAATRPRPADKAMVKPATAVELNWAPGRDVTTHKVYFGTSIDKLPLLGEVKTPSYDELPTPERGITYYWRVDEVRADGSVVPGDVWSFGTGKLVVWWKLDGDAKDSSSNDNHGTLVGDPQWVAGRIDSALEFDGVDDYVDVGDRPSLDFGAADSFSISAWIRTGADSHIVSKRRCGGVGGVYYEGYGLRLTGGELFFAVEDISGKGAGIRGDTMVTDDEWHHVAAVRDTTADELYLYLDGSSDATPLADPTTSTLNTDKGFDIGHGINTVTGHGYFSGEIDDVRIYNYALSEEEILEICPAVKAVSPQPANRAIVKPGADVKLGWRPGKDATAHRIYFGTNTDKLSVLAEVKTPSYPKLPRVQKGITYYWRIDEVQADGSVVTGDIWSFSTGKLVAWWKFDEKSGNTASDSSGNKYNGTAVRGNPIWKPDGKFGGCLDFNERYGISIPKDVFDGIDKAITISVWVNGNQRQKKHSDVILQAGAGDAGKPYIVSIYTDWLDYGLKFATGIGEPDRLEFNPGAPEDWTGRWNHYAFVKDADKGFQRIYMNGSLVAESGAMASMSGVGAARIGIAPDRFGDQHVGKLDDFRIYNYALSSEEIQQLCDIVPGFGPVVEPVEPAPPPAPSFGPVAEVELSDIDESPQAALIDFDTGTLVKIPDRLCKAGEDEAFPWVASRGLDVGAEFAGDEYGLFGIDVVATRIAPEQWDKITPAELHEALAAEPIGVQKDERATIMPAKGEYRPTFAFRTREGGMGVLQILGFAEGKPRGVRIRYKMLQPGAEEPILKLQVVEPKREWWRVEPRITKTIYEGSDLEIEWDVGKTTKRIKTFAVGVLPIKEDISDLPAHYYWQDNLAFTVRRTPYGKEWGRSTGSRVSPKTLKPGEYRVYVCAFAKYRHGESWPSRLTDVIGAGTAKLIVKPRPQAPALVPGFGPAKPLPVDELIKSGRVPAFRTVLHGNSALDLETGAVVPLPVERTRAEVSVRPGAMIGAAVAVKTQAQWPEGFDVAWSYEGGEALAVRPDSAVRIVAIPGAKKERWDQAISMARGALATLRTSTADKIFAGQTNFAAVLTTEGNLATVEIGEYRQEKATLYWWIERPMAKRPVPTGYCKIFLPEAESAVNDLLDLASGTLRNSDAMRRDVAYFERLGQGDIAFDEINGQDWLFCFRGARMQRRLGDGLTSSEPDRVEGAGFIYLYQVREVPSDFVVTTAEGHKYELKVLSRERGDRLGVNIEYWKSAGAPAKFTSAVAVLHPDSAVKLSRLGKAVAVYAADNNGKLPATLQELKPYVGGGDFKWLIENVRYFGKGQESEEPDTPIAYDKTLLEKGNGTNILFLDGHVEFRQAEELTSVKHTIEHR